MKATDLDFAGKRCGVRDAVVKRDAGGTGAGIHRHARDASHCLETFLDGDEVEDAEEVPDLECSGLHVQISCRLFLLG
jgi:hypothetical protein